MNLGMCGPALLSDPEPFHLSSSGIIHAHTHAHTHACICACERASFVTKLTYLARYRPNIPRSAETTELD